MASYVPTQALCYAYKMAVYFLRFFFVLERSLCVVLLYSCWSIIKLILGYNSARSFYLLDRYLCVEV